MPRSRSINQDDLRNHNLSVVLKTLLQSRTPLSRAQLAKQTGLTKATMSLLSEILLGNDVVEQLAPLQESTNGRPSTPLGFHAGRWAGMGMQVNTDGYGYTVLDIAGRVVMTQWVDRDMTQSTPDDVFEALDDLVRPVEVRLKRRRYRLVGTGLALPGLIADDRHLIMAPNLGWANLELERFAVVRRLDADVDNEANLAAIAQIPGYAVHRAADETGLEPDDSFLYISTDIGVGGAIVRSGGVMRGDHGFGGELGHMSVDMNGPKCRCGRRGCLEMYAGRRELVRAAGIADGADAAAASHIDELYRRWKGGDVRTVMAIEQALDAMASAAVSVINMVDVSTIVLGGFWSGFEEDLASKLRIRIVPQLLARYAMDVRVLDCKTVERPALYGAACLGMRRFIDRPVGYLDI
ncbi:NagC family transcriptional regulator [Bifidobacterium primatium]|uniref:NagC family transcriptional regulator n=1 Tax=Bifidobacterium primatium TaxID=2045438 RepID=A0A2M9H764_9BIFI|nr:ROK family protein [Bifidobacterium primatium]PJM72649.1 NagC family transcriptional regulator [Bifidobacterium primatium]